MIDQELIVCNETEVLTRQFVEDISRPQFSFSYSISGDRFPLLLSCILLTEALTESNVHFDLDHQIKRNIIS